MEPQVHELVRAPCKKHQLVPCCCLKKPCMLKCAAIHFGQSERHMPQSQLDSLSDASMPQPALGSPTFAQAGQLPAASSQEQQQQQQQQQQQYQAGSSYPVTPLAQARTDVTVIPTSSGNELVGGCVRVSAHLFACALLVRARVCPYSAKHRPCALPVLRASTCASTSCCVDATVTGCWADSAGCLLYCCC